MKVDMSATAVAQRLKILEELWELSVSLMRAKPQQSAITTRQTQSQVETGNTRDDDTRDMAKSFER